MNDKPSEIENEDQAVVSKSNEHFNPVVVTDTVGALFLGAISLILMAVVTGLLLYIRKLEEMSRENDQSVD